MSEGGILGDNFRVAVFEGYSVFTLTSQNSLHFM
jgi:hypothetical protein